MTIRLLSGDCRDVLATLPDASVHCVVTSPPYYGLRDYGTAQWDGGDAACDHIKIVHKPASYSGHHGSDRGCQSWRGGERNQSEPYGHVCGKCGARRIDRQLGLEATPEAYLQAMVEVFREVRRVLRPDGTLWCNMGDGHRDKQLLMMPARLALALQADGWWLRSDIIWAKPNPMPESVTDRPTSAHEHVFLLTKSARYFYDADAVREESITNDPRRPYTSEGAKQLDGRAEWKSGQRRDGADFSSRSLRNVWTIPTHAYSAAHFATYPPALVERCIRAGTSERGCCAQCGKPWVRVVERTGEVDVSAKGSYFDRGKTGARDGGDRTQAGERFSKQATGWQPVCGCYSSSASSSSDIHSEYPQLGQQSSSSHLVTVSQRRQSCIGHTPESGEIMPQTKPCVILDPFAGAGTTLLVADRLQRNAIGIELNAAYTEMAMERVKRDAPLFADMPSPDNDTAYDMPMRDLFAEVAD